MHCFFCFIVIFKILFVFLNFLVSFKFLTELGLFIAMQTFSSCGERGYFQLLCVCFSMQWLLVVAEHSSRFSFSRHGSFQSSGQNSVSPLLGFLTAGPLGEVLIFLIEV